ncbi:MAG: glycosyltransferase family 39 protein, partial [Acidobacteria bacterium]|nr:glycosyltransferase family 39 protein [Acidobacteriota bacterium]
ASVGRLFAEVPDTALRDHLCLALAVVLFVSGVGFVSFQRQYFNYGTETDFLGGFLPEAQRFLNADPLELPAHPPAYPITVALLSLVIGDWGITGRLISLAAAAVVLVCAYFVFLPLGGRLVAWGATLGLAASNAFLQYASVSTSDMFFAALFWLSALLSLRAVEAKSSVAWFLSGLLVGLALLSRTNAVVAIPFLFGACLPGTTGTQKWRFSLVALGGFLLPLSLWALYALVTGSTLMPSATPANLALTYFGGRERGTFEGMLKVQKFESLLAVLLHDPVRMAAVYAKDLALLTFRLPLSLNLPLPLFLVPGLFLLVMRPMNQRTFLLLSVIGLSLLVNNLRAFESRFFLYVLPLLGAGVGEMYERIASAAPRRWMRASAAVLLAITYGAAVTMAQRKSFQQLYEAEQELSEAIPAARQILEANAVIVARKQVVAHYVGAKSLYLPEVEGIEELHEFLQHQDHGQSLYVYFGSIEMRLRPRLAMLAKAADAPDWLRPVAEGDTANSWVLYRYQPGD